MKKNQRFPLDELIQVLTETPSLCWYLPTSISGIDHKLSPSSSLVSLEA